MYFIHIFLYYAFFCSAVLFFGIGLNRSIQITANSLRLNFKVLLKSFISIFATTILTHLILVYILIPIHLNELFPLVALMIFLSINIFIEALVRITTHISTAEFAVSWLIIVLSLYESGSFVEAMVICTSCMVSFMVMLPLVYCFQKYIYLRPFETKERKQVLIFLSVSALMLVLSVCDVVWYNIR